MWFLIPLVFVQILFQAEPPHFESTINEVLVDVQVLDQTTNQPIPGLGAKDFEVRDNGQAVALASFGDRPLPLDVAIAIDVSGGFAHNAAKLFSEELFRRLSPEDRFAIVSFSRRTRRRLPLTSSEGLFFKSIKETFQTDREFSTTTCLYDGLWDAAEMLDHAESRRRKVILALSHDREGRSRRTANEIVQAILWRGLHFEGVSLTQTQQKRKALKGFGVFGRGGSRTIPAPSPPPVEVLPSLGSMQSVANRTGGVVQFLDEPAERASAPTPDDEPRDKVKQAVDDLVLRLRAAYRLSFSGQHAGQATFHTIEVLLSDQARAKYPNAAIYSRGGYVAGP